MQHFLRMGLKLLAVPRCAPASACGRKLSGEPDEGNLHVRFAEGRVGRLYRARPLSYSTGFYLFTTFSQYYYQPTNRRVGQTAPNSAPHYPANPLAPGKIVQKLG